jgi:hypothetical protein
VATARDIVEEDRRMRFLRFLMTLTANVIMQGNLTRPEAEALVESARTRILRLFPGCDETFEIVYGRRFRRLVAEYTRPDPLAPTIH